jgi:cell division protein DivIC
MSLASSHTTSFTKLIIIVEFLLVAYLLYSLTKNIYSSYQIDQYIESFEQENTLIEQENKQKNADYLYFTSEEYIDKIAKQNLGLVNPGEEIIIVSSESLAQDVDESVAGESDDYAKSTGVSNPQAWWDFFFGD